LQVVHSAANGLKEHYSISFLSFSMMIWRTSP
jgi:hypothetical protein